LFNAVIEISLLGSRQLLVMLVEVQDEIKTTAKAQKEKILFFKIKR
jgi:hypothetical protein